MHRERHIDRETAHDVHGVRDARERRQHVVIELDAGELLDRSNGERGSSPCHRAVDLVRAEARDHDPRVAREPEDRHGLLLEVDRQDVDGIRETAGHGRAGPSVASQHEDEDRLGAGERRREVGVGLADDEAREVGLGRGYRTNAAERRPGRPDRDGREGEREAPARHDGDPEGAAPEGDA